jgi:hypothetical protein
MDPWFEFMRKYFVSMLPAKAIFILANITPIFLNQLYESAIKLHQTDAIETGIGGYQG